MIKFKKELSLLIAGSFLFNYLFWNEDFGLNILLFTVFLTASILILFPSFRKSLQAMITVSGTIITSIFVVLHSSDFAVIMYWLSALLMIGFIHQTELKSIAYAIPTTLSNYLSFFGTLYKDINQQEAHSNKISGAFRFLKVILIPVILLVIFYFLFKFGNPVFDSFTTAAFQKINEWFLHLFGSFSFFRILFFFSGFILIGGLVYNSQVRIFLLQELKLNNFISRKKSILNRIPNVQIFPLNLGLKKELQGAIFMMTLINLMLIIVNLIDIIYVWLHFEYSPSINLKHFVHEGTYLLIISILLSIGIMLYYFRQNLNFHPKRNTLKILAYIWIAQNAILLISVVIKNYHYIHYFGLAYKRIGVLIFLILVLIGLYTLYVKIGKLKSAYYLFKINTWAVYIVLTLASLVNWDSMITSHNLNHPLKDNMETSFLLTLSDKILPEIDKRQDILSQSTELNTYASFGDMSYQEVYGKRVYDFLTRKKTTSWLSWNWAESKTLEYYNQKKKKKK